jgi:glycosyltransferase involved in cell wall biosynthesis
MTMICPNQGMIKYHETGQLVVAESVMCGTPVLSSRNGGIVDYVLPEVGRTGRNVKEMARLLPEVWNMDHAKVREFGLQHFNIMNWGEQWETILQEAL